MTQVDPAAVADQVLTASDLAMASPVEIAEAAEVVGAVVEVSAGELADLAADPTAGYLAGVVVLGGAAPDGVVPADVVIGVDQASSSVNFVVRSDSMHYYSAASHQDH